MHLGRLSLSPLRGRSQSLGIGTPHRTGSSCPPPFLFHRRVSQKPHLGQASPAGKGDVGLFASRPTTKRYISPDTPKKHSYRCCYLHGGSVAVQSLSLSPKKRRLQKWYPQGIARLFAGLVPARRSKSVNGEMAIEIPPKNGPKHEVERQRGGLHNHLPQRQLYEHIRKRGKPTRN